MYRAVGKTYTIKTNVPLLSTFEADIPVDEMTADALAVVREDAKQALPWVIAGGAVVVTLSVVAAAVFFLGKRRFA